MTVTFFVLYLSVLVSNSSPKVLDLVQNGNFSIFKSIFAAIFVTIATV